MVSDNFYDGWLTVVTFDGARGAMRGRGRVSVRSVEDGVGGMSAREARRLGVDAATMGIEFVENVAYGVLEVRTQGAVVFRTGFVFNMHTLQDPREEDEGGEKEKDEDEALDKDHPLVIMLDIYEAATRNETTTSQLLERLSPGAVAEVLRQRIGDRRARDLVGDFLVSIASVISSPRLHVDVFLGHIGLLGRCMDASKPHFARFLEHVELARTCAETWMRFGCSGFLFVVYRMIDKATNSCRDALFAVPAIGEALMLSFFEHEKFWGSTARDLLLTRASESKSLVAALLRALPAFEERLLDMTFHPDEEVARPAIVLASLLKSGLTRAMAPWLLGNLASLSSKKRSDEFWRFLLGECKAHKGLVAEDVFFTLLKAWNASSVSSHRDSTTFGRDGLANGSSCRLADADRAAGVETSADQTGSVACACCGGQTRRRNQQGLAFCSRGCQKRHWNKSKQASDAAQRTAARVGEDGVDGAAAAVTEAGQGFFKEDVEEATKKIAAEVADRNMEAAEERRRRREQRSSSSMPGPRPSAPPRMVEGPQEEAQPMTSTRRLNAKAKKNAHRRKLAMLAREKQKVADGDFAKFTQLSRHAEPSLGDPIDLENLPSVQHMKGLLARSAKKPPRRHVSEERRIAQVLFV